MKKPKKEPGDKSESPVWKIVTAILVTLVAGGTIPWWIPKREKPKEPEKPVLEKKVSRECDPQVLRESLFRAGPQRAAFLTAAASTMKNKFGDQEFDCVLELARVLVEQDPDNGHGLYFQGEVWRLKAANDASHSLLCRDRMREYFLRYLANERRLPTGERDGDSSACYQRERGYCKERTAWINHLMAVEYRQWAEDVGDKTTKVKRLELAAGFSRVDLDFGGFDAVTPSAVLREKIEEDFQRVGAPYPQTP
ncbi:MAG TPA: hypothetical protein VJU77_07915 [Chthoniobacterales bacterium]|nr:hypothetical protein [Chthoniobacterales bacterium]